MRANDTTHMCFGKTKTGSIGWGVDFGISSSLTVAPTRDSSRCYSHCDSGSHWRHETSRKCWKREPLVCVHFRWTKSNTGGMWWFWLNWGSGGGWDSDRLWCDSYHYGETTDLSDKNFLEVSETGIINLCMFWIDQNGCQRGLIWQKIEIVQFWHIFIIPMTDFWQKNHGNLVTFLGICDYDQAQPRKKTSWVFLQFYESSHLIVPYPYIPIFQMFLNGHTQQ